MEGMVSSHSRSGRLTMVTLIFVAAGLLAMPGYAEYLEGPFVPGSGSWNTLYNGGWELGNTDGWYYPWYFHPSHYAATQEKAAVGDWSLKSVMHYELADGLCIKRDVTGLTNGVTYVFSAFFYTGQAIGSTMIDRDGSSPYLNDQAYGKDKWQFVWNTWTANTTSTAIRILRYKPANTTDIGMYYDEIAVTPAASFVAPTPCVIPSFTTHPQNQSKFVGQTATFTAEATGTESPSYKWQKKPSGGSWGDISGETSSSYTTPALVIGDNGSQYRCVATNCAGSANSDEATLTVSEALSVGDAKKKANGESVSLASKTVTAIFAEYFYIEEEDRSSGIHVDPSEMPEGLALGNIVNASGTIETNTDDERYVDASSVTIIDSGTPLDPVGMNSKALGGADTPEYHPETGAGQKGVEDGEGTNTIGKLVKVTGEVTARGGDFFYIVDGYGGQDFSVIHWYQSFLPWYCQTVVRHNAIRYKDQPDDEGQRTGIPHPSAKECGRHSGAIIDAMFGMST